MNVVFYISAVIATVCTARAITHRNAITRCST